MAIVYDLIVIGGGAAGLMAAGTAAERGRRVLVLEKMEKPARKVRITGKGRCNLTNIKPEDEFLEKIKVNEDFFLPAYREFDNRRLVKFFEKRGVRLATEQGGRVFPKSGKAWDISDALIEWCRDTGVEIECYAKTERILTLMNKVRGVEYRNRKGFVRRVEAPAVLLATGGASYPATGSTGDGYRLANELGHSIEAVRPSLVPLVPKLDNSEFLNGLHLRNVNVTLLVDGEEAGEEFGEMSFSDRGVEGAVVLRLSRTAVDALIDERSVELQIDLKSALSEKMLRERIERELAELELSAPTSDLLRKMVPKELVVPVSRLIDSHPKRELKQFGAEKIEALIKVLKCFRVPVEDYRSWEYAIVTAGGVSVAEIDRDTMASKLVKGLYFAGEVLDVDADTGGYNLQVAFSTGRLAGQLRANDPEDFIRDEETEEE